MKNGKEGVVREIMTGSPVTLKPEDTLDLANNVISLGRIRHIPVVEDGRLIGLLSERDLMGAATTEIFGLKQKRKSALLKTVMIKDVMQKRVITVKPDTPIKDAAQLMADKKIGCDAGGRERNVGGTSHDDRYPEIRGTVGLETSNSQTTATELLSSNGESK
jgi:CBS domain-containing protein